MILKRNRRAWRPLVIGQSHSVNYANHQHSPGGDTTLETTFSPLLFGKSFMKISYFLAFADEKKTKKTKKNICKTYTLPHHRRLRKIGH